MSTIEKRSSVPAVNCDENLLQDQIAHPDTTNKLAKPSKLKFFYTFLLFLGYVLLVSLLLFSFENFLIYFLVLFLNWFLLLLKLSDYLVMTCSFTQLFLSFNHFEIRLHLLIKFLVD